MSHWNWICRISTGIVKQNLHLKPKTELIPQKITSICSQRIIRFHPPPCWCEKPPLVTSLGLSSLANLGRMRIWRLAFGWRGSQETCKNSPWKKHLELNFHVANLFLPWNWPIGKPPKWSVFYGQRLMWNNEFPEFWGCWRNKKTTRTLVRVELLNSVLKQKDDPSNLLIISVGTV